ncbi:MAG: hypothetical protein A2V85_14695 [Chloroflexi bacterium RBG_16_72_14]|nr:MAG: hypothetical protein A2V85_14695 [Chloroflexi bacterium RBG_16_72_14]
MRLRHLALAPALVLVVAACSGTGSTASPSAGAGSPSPDASASAAGQTIEVTLTDALKMDPAEMTVKAGEPVTFVVTNAGAIQHEFYLGDVAAQDAHEQEMMSGGMAMDEPDGIVLKPGETRELTHTFLSAGASIAGCHEPGHYAGGMKAAITVTE